MLHATVTEAVINQIADDIHGTALEKGFWEPPDAFLAEINTKLMLIVSEVAEAMEVLRKNYDGPPVAFSQMTEMQQEDFIEELMDIVIRTFDLARYFGEEAGEVMLGKMATNAKRPRKHGKRF